MFVGTIWTVSWSMPEEMLGDCDVDIRIYSMTRALRLWLGIVGHS